MRIGIVLAVIIMSMTVTAFAEEMIWEEQTAVEDVTYAESVFEEQTVSKEQIASEAPEYVFEEPEVVEETIDEETVFEEIALDEKSEEQEENVEESAFEELYVSEEIASDESALSLQENEGLIYTGEPQDLIKYQEGCLYSIDGKTYTSEIPTGINAGSYTIYMKEEKEENEETVPIIITVTIAKADVTFTPPMPNTCA